MRAETALGAFTAIPLEVGENQITMRFLPKGLRLGVGISVASLLACIAWCIMQKSWTEKANKKTPLLLGFYYAIDYGTIIAIYIVPIVCRIYTFLSQ